MKNNPFIKKRKVILRIHIILPEDKNNSYC